MTASFKVALWVCFAASVVVASSFERRDIKFSTIDISRKSGSGQEFRKLAEVQCPLTDSKDVLNDKTLAAENAELKVFNPAIEKAKGAGETAKAKALQCQKDRNKILKNTCGLAKAKVEKNKAQIDLNTKQVQKNIKDVDSRCANVDTSLFIGDGSSSASKAPARSAASTPSRSAATSASPASPVKFSTIDISRNSGSGQEIRKLSESKCPLTDSKDVLNEKTLAAENAELKIFNPAIEKAKGAGEEAKAKALQCQKDRNKILKNTCGLAKGKVEKDQSQIDLNTKQVQKNIKDVDKRCANVDTSLFIKN